MAVIICYKLVQRSNHDNLAHHPNQRWENIDF